MNINKRIEIMRNHLNNTITKALEKNLPLNEGKVLEISLKLDKLIIQKMKSENNKY